jgi:hypothetical protein
MPARDIYHASVKVALVKDGWRITHDPLRLRWRATDTYVDLGAERLLAAEKGNEEIAIEIKSFVGRSMVDDLEDAVGQYMLYEELLKRLDPERVLYLAVTEEVYQNTFVDALGELFLESQRLRLLVFDPEKEALVSWIR